VWIAGLLRVSKLIHHDMPWVIKSWRPVCRLEKLGDSSEMRIVLPFVVNGTKCWPKLKQLDIIGK
jgi:hypothetical protein